MFSNKKKKNFKDNFEVKILSLFHKFDIILLN